MGSDIASSSRLALEPAPMIRLVEDRRASRLIKQGAEAKVYISRIFGRPHMTSSSGASGPLEQDASSSPRQGNVSVLIKHRFPKTYRHPSLSAHLTASRTAAEARALVRCSRAGVHTPRVLCVDEESGILGLELIDGHSVRELLGGGAEGEELDDLGAGERDTAREEVGAIGIAQQPAPILNNDEALEVMRLIGRQLARMHQAHIVHGDLTTSNMMLRRGPRGTEVVLIDFGLAANFTSAEDKAVDLYVLERAFISTHPHSEHLFGTILSAYQHTLESRPVAPQKTDEQRSVHKQNSRSAAQKGQKLSAAGTHWKEIQRKLDDVRLRGRKRSMVG